MSAFKHVLHAAFALLCLTAFGTQGCLAQEWTKDPTTWWPDPSTGLMWAGQVHGSPHPDPKLASPFTPIGQNGLNWQQANDYCASLQLGRFTGWRLPTMDEVKAATVTRKTTGPYPNTFMENKAMREADNAVSQIPFDALFFKTNAISIFGAGTTIWTSTPYPDDAESVWIVMFDAQRIPFSKCQMMLTPPWVGVECVRPMEADLLQTAKDAQVNRPVPDVQTLKGYITLNQAHLAYQAGQYQQSLTQAQEALAQNADPENAYLGIGASYGQLGQWDQAVANIQSALKINKNYKDAKTALKWAKDGQKVASKGKQTSKPSPKWD